VDGFTVSSAFCGQGRCVSMFLPLVSSTMFPGAYASRRSDPVAKVDPALDAMAMVSRGFRVERWKASRVQVVIAALVFSLHERPAPRLSPLNGMHVH
jgi:hypothetical protein